MTTNLKKRLYKRMAPTIREMMEMKTTRLGPFLGYIEGKIQEEVDENLKSHWIKIFRFIADDDKW